MQWRTTAFIPRSSAVPIPGRGKAHQSAAVNADGYQLAAKPIKAARPCRPDAADRHAEPSGRICVAAAGRIHQVCEQPPVRCRQPAKSRSNSRVLVPCHCLVFGRAIAVRRVEVLSSRARTLSPTVLNHETALSVGGRRQPRTNRAGITQRVEMLDQTQPRCLRDIAPDRRVQPVGACYRMQHAGIPADEFLPRLAVSGRRALHELCGRNRRPPGLHFAYHSEYPCKPNGRSMQQCCGRGHRKN
jgi:hypothetical protein